MDSPREGIFRSSIRAMFMAFFTLIGLSFGLLIFFGLMASSGLSDKTEVERTTAIKVLPNAEGVRKALGAKEPVILHISLSGVVGLDHLTAAKIQTILTESREGQLKDNRVKALLLSINTPGGTVADADGIFHAINTYKKRYGVPVIAYVDGICASGGMYIAAAADKLVANDVSIVGSIGVTTAPFFNFTDLLDKLGVKSLTLYSGKGKDAMNPFRPWREGEQESFQVLIKELYDHFVNLIVQNRPKVSRDKLVDVYGADVFSASKAAEIGFIDASGYEYNDALQLTLKTAGLEGQEYSVVQLEDENWLETLFKMKSPMLLTGKVEHHLLLSPELDPRLMGKPLYLYQPH